MIVSASRRTDIPAFYMEWMLARLRAGFALVRNPMNPAQVRRVGLTPEEADCIVFWSKNPAPLLARIGELESFGIPFGINFTLNAYRADFEPRLPPVETRLDTFRALAGRIGRRKMTWRYDPILFTPEYDETFHIDRFGRLAQALAGHTERCIVSFLDFYARTVRNTAGKSVCDPPPKDRNRLAAELARIGREYGIEVEACAESGLCLPAGACIGSSWVRAICGRGIDERKDPGQRPLCNCVRSADIGSVNCCPHGCLYCYANRTPGSARKNAAAYDPASPFLCSSPA